MWLGLFGNLEHHHWTSLDHDIWHSFFQDFSSLSPRNLRNLLHIVARRKGTHFLDPDRDGAV